MSIYVPLRRFEFNSSGQRPSGRPESSDPIYLVVLLVIAIGLYLASALRRALAGYMGCMLGLRSCLGDRDSKSPTLGGPECTRPPTAMVGTLYLGAPLPSA